LAEAEVDSLLIDASAATWAGAERTLWVAGVNAARSSASDAAVTTLQGKSVTVTTNGDPTIFEFDVVSTQTIAGVFRTSSTSDSITVYWGDGTSNKYAGTTDQAYSKNYGSSGNRTVTIIATSEAVLTKYTMTTSGANVSFALSDLPSGLTNFVCTGSNTVSGDLADLPSGLAEFYCTGNNTVSGALSGLPSGLEYFRCTGSNTVSGAFSDLPSGLTYFRCQGSNTVSGALSDLPSGLTTFDCQGSNTVSGALSGLPSGLAYFNCQGSNTVSGALSGLPSGLTYFNCQGSNTVSGDLADIPSGVLTFDCQGLNQISDYTAGYTWNNNINRIYLSQAATYGFTETEVDSLLVNASAATWAGAVRVLWIAGVNAARSAASDAAVTTLQGKSVTVTTN